MIHVPIIVHTVKQVLLPRTQTSTRAYVRRSWSTSSFSFFLSVYSSLSLIRLLTLWLSYFAPLCPDSRLLVFFHSFDPFFAIHGVTCLLSCSVIRSICSFIFLYLLFSYQTLSICPYRLSYVCPSLFSLCSLPLGHHSLTLIVFLLIHRPLSFHHLSSSYSLFRTSAFVVPSIYPFLSLFNLSSSVVFLYLLGYLLFLSLQRSYTGSVSRSARIACVLVCDTLATTELAQTRRQSVHTRWTSCTKSCVNGVACAGILESFVVDGISFKVVTEGGVNSLEKITSGSLLILSRFKYRTMGFMGRMNYYRDSLVYCLYNNWFHRWAFLLLFIFHLKRTPIL